MKAKKMAAEVVDGAFYAQVRDVFVEARQIVRATANFAMVKAYWLVGKMIVEKQGGAAKAVYGDGLIDSLAEKLTQEFGAGFARSNLRNMRQFYLSFTNCHTLCGELSWSHYRLLMTVENEEARQYYLEEARKSLWSVRELQRQINSFYYERLLENRAKKRGGKNAVVAPLKPLNKMTPHNKRLFAAKYKLHLPSEQELIAELRRERVAQHPGVHRLVLR